MINYILFISSIVVILGIYYYLMRKELQATLVLGGFKRVLNLRIEGADIWVKDLDITELEKEQLVPLLKKLYAEDYTVLVGLCEIHNIKTDNKK